MKGVSVVIPAYNESASIERVIGDMKRSLSETGCEFEIIVVDDGSADNTGKIAENCGARVIFHPANGGYGKSILAGINVAKYEYIATTDADDSYPAEEIIRLLKHIDEFDLVVGARKGKEFWGTFLKHPARLVFLWLAEYTVGGRIPDVNSGLRVFKKSSFNKLAAPLLCPGFSFSTTMTLSFLLNGLFVKFVPIAYLSRTGHSKVRYFRDTLRTIQALVEIITYYNPLKMVLILDFVPLAFALLFAILGLLRHSASSFAMAVVSLYFAILFFIGGLLLDLLRMNRK
jgi:polyisoprenyl-phosphate glycosyltransferase